MESATVRKIDGQDKRGAQRERALLLGTMSYANGKMMFPCIMMNISATGAKINTVNDGLLPQIVQIEIPQRKIKTATRIVRVEGDSVFLHFEQAVQSSQSAIDVLTAKIRDLEKDNTRLRATCDDLTLQVNRFSASY